MCPIKLPSFDHFDLLAPWYERVITTANVDYLAPLLALEPHHRLLDVGGGTGRVTAPLARRVAQTVITDLSAGMLQQAAAKDGLQPANAHAELLPFAANSFDRVMIVDALHHVCDQALTAAELLRVLAPDGRLVVEEPNIETGRVKLIAIAEKLALMRSHFLGPAAMQTLFEKAGGRATIHTRPDNDFNVWLVVTK